VFAAVFPRPLQRQPQLWSCTAGAGVAEDDVILNGKRHTLGVQHGEEVGDAILGALPRQQGGLACAGGAGFLMTLALTLPVMAGLGVLDLLQREQHRLLIGGQGGVGTLSGGLDLLPHAAQIQKGPADARPEAAGVEAIPVEAGKGLPLDVEAAAKGDAREQVGGGPSDAGGGGFEMAFREADVGTQAQKFGRPGDGDAARDGRLSGGLLKLRAPA
jgi:hypothetical protein